MAMAMAIARARMAMVNRCNGFRQMFVRRFKPGVGEGINKSDNRSFSSVGAPGSGSGSLGSSLLVFGIFGYLGDSIWQKERNIRELKKENKEGKARLKAGFEVQGITREHCEENIAMIKQKIESGSDSYVDREELKKFERWLDIIKG